MPTAAKKEKLQLYLNSEQIDRLHRLKGQVRGSSLSGIVEDALKNHFAQIDRSHQHATN